MKSILFLKCIFLSIFLMFFSCKKKEIEIRPSANFSTLIIEFGDVTFRNKSFNATSYLWDFGDGNTSTEKDPVHSYFAVGNYNVTLTASDGINSDDFTLVVAIGQVFPQNLTRLDRPPLGERVEAFSFTHDGKGYAGGGVQYSPVYSPMRDLWEFDPATKAWAIVSQELPENFSSAVSFVSGDNAYIGLGQGSDNNFYSFNFQDQIFNFESTLPNVGAGISGAVAFVHNDIPYIIGKESFSMNTDDKKIRKYDIASQSWSTIGNYECSGNTGMFHFLLGDKLYIGMGNDAGFNSFGDHNDIWEYDVINNSWTQKNDFPGVGRRDGISFTYDGDGYFGFGIGYDSTTGIQTFFSDLWKYNPTDDSWEKVADFPITPKFNLYAFVLNNSLYFGGGLNNNYQPTDHFYEYEF